VAALSRSDVERGADPTEEGAIIDDELFELAPVGLCRCSFLAAKALLAAREPNERSARALAADIEGLRAVVAAIRFEAVNAMGLKLLGASSLPELRHRLPELVTLSSCHLFGELLAAVASQRPRTEVTGTLSALDDAERTVTLGFGAVATGAVVTIVRAGAAAGTLAEEELARVRFEVERVFYAVSHDLRAPLRGVANLAGWIDEDLRAGRDKEVYEHIEMLLGRVGRMDDMLTALLLYAHASHSAQAVRTVSVAEVIAELTSDKAKFPAKFEVVCGELPTLRAQPDLLTRVFDQLLDNAVKHHDREEGTISVTAKEEDGQWRFRVADDGPGIPARYRHRVFHIFSTLRRRDEVEGSGMGLAFVRKVVLRQGGRISIEANEPRGAAINFTWPTVVEAPKPGPASRRSGRVV
jgi:signal transduction histidine kinase